MNEQINKLREQTDWKPWCYVSPLGSTFKTTPTSSMTSGYFQDRVKAAEETTQIIYDMMGKA